MAKLIYPESHDIPEGEIRSWAADLMTDAARDDGLLDGYTDEQVHDYWKLVYGQYSVEEMMAFLEDEGVATFAGK